MRAILRAGSNDATTAASTPSANAVAMTEGTTRIAAVSPLSEFGPGGMGIPTAEISSASSTPIITPKVAPIKSVTVNGKEWRDFDAARELVRLNNVTGKVAVTVSY